MSTNARRDDGGTDQLRREALDDGGGGFEFDSEFVLDAASAFQGLREQLDQAAGTVAGNADDISDELKKLDKMLSRGLPTGPRPPVTPGSDFPELATALRTAVNNIGRATDHTARGLLTAGRNYYAQDREAYLYWKKTGHHVRNLRDEEDREKLKYEGDA